MPHTHDEPCQEHRTLDSPGSQHAADALNCPIQHRSAPEDPYHRQHNGTTSTPGDVHSVVLDDYTRFFISNRRNDAARSISLAREDDASYAVDGSDGAVPSRASDNMVNPEASIQDSDSTEQSSSSTLRALEARLRGNESHLQMLQSWLETRSVGANSHESTTTTAVGGQPIQDNIRTSLLAEGLRHSATHTAAVAIGHDFRGQDGQLRSPTAQSDPRMDSTEMDTRRARLGLVVPSANHRYSELRTPLYVRGPQTPNPLTAIVQQDPAVREHITPPASPAASPQLEQPSAPRPFGRYTPSHLHQGSTFYGSQRSDKRTYNVEVTIQHMDMDKSFICGFLRIKDLAPGRPTLETYFDGEIIGSKYTFVTQHPEWGATAKQDHIHWNRFQSYKPLARAAQDPEFTYNNFAEREHVFMRWKERFLVPDHNVTAINGASFQGFYYICYNQRSGCISGIYHHANEYNPASKAMDKWQQLELQHQGGLAQMPAVEMR